MQVDAAELQKSSVTRNDAQDAKMSGGPLLISPYQFFLQRPSLLPDLPIQWSHLKDWWLRIAIYYEPLWASAFRKAISKIAARSFQVKDTSDSSRRTAAAMRLFQTYNGLGWVAGISQTAGDYLGTSNGAFAQIVRQSSARGSRVKGFKHMDSRRTRRTGDPAYPLIYTDLDGYEHYLKDYQVMMFADQPRPDAELFGVGFCATEGAYAQIQELAYQRLFKKEKITGTGATAWYIIQGLTDKTLESSIKTGENAQRERNTVLYKGALITGVPAGDQLTMLTLPLKSLPDGFDEQKSFDDAVIIYSNHLGIQVQDIRPLSGQFGAGEQTRVLDEAANSMGQAAFVKDFEHQVNEKALPHTTTFYLAINDINDQKQQAEVMKLRAEVRKQMIDNGEIDATIARQMALDAGDLAPELFDAVDATPGGTLTDSQKPLSETDQQTTPEAMDTPESELAVVDEFID